MSAIGGPAGTGPVDTGSVRTLACPNCGAAVMQRGLAWTQVIACASCSSVLDAHDPNLTVLSRFDGAVKIKPAIPLGSRGQWRGALYEVIGFQVMTITVDMVRYSWREYLLFNPYHGFRFLTEYDGHWNDVVTLRALPASVKGGGGAVTYHGHTYKHFQTATATTTYVLGEFPWEVRRGDAVTASDYVDPPRMLSSESAERETNWSLGEYVEGKEIWRAFKLPGSPPPVRGIFANQPSPHATRGSLWPVFGLLAGLLLLLMLARLVTAGNATVYSGTRDFTRADSGNAAFVTPTFELRGGEANVSVELETDLDNSWMYVNYALINESTGAAYDFGREVGFYSGYDEGNWTEGSRSDKARIGGIPGGRYFLRVESELPPEARTVHGSLTVRRDVPSFLPFLLALLALLVPPLFLTFRSYGFEVKRWAESDHPLVQVSTDTDEDDDE
jgi:hypothetical protein